MREQIAWNIGKNFQLLGPRENENIQVWPLRKRLIKILKTMFIQPAVNFINVKCANFLYERSFSSYVLALSKNSYKKFVCKTLMKLTPEKFSRWDMRIVESLANPFTLSTLPRSGSTWNVILHEVELGVVHKWRHIILYTFWTPGSVVNFFITKALTLSSQTRSLTPPETWRQLWMTLSNTIPQFPELDLMILR